MSSTTRARTVADGVTSSAAPAADVEVTELTAVDDLKATAKLLADVWATPIDRAPISADVLRALSHNGNYVAGAWQKGSLVGASVGFLGLEGANLKLHSHITGIAPAAQGKHIGQALKLHQRAWALDHGIDTITWTFDPLIRRNAYFNLVKLGAAITAYHPHFYGAMEDGVNAGDESDRCVVEWALNSPRAEAAAAGNGALSGGSSPSGEAVLRADDDGAPVAAGGSGGVRLAWIPDDIVAVRARDPRLAMAWRRALRDVFLDALDAGLAATTMTRDGHYVFQSR